VILLADSNECYLSLAKRRILEKKKKQQGLKSKRGETSFKKLHVSKGEKKTRMRFIS
jgi:hypothetical protein